MGTLAPLQGMMSAKDQLRSASNKSAVLSVPFQAQLTQKNPSEATVTPALHSSTLAKNKLTNLIKRGATGVSSIGSSKLTASNLDVETAESQAQPALNALGEVEGPEADSDGFFKADYDLGDFSEMTLEEKIL